LSGPENRVIDVAGWDFNFPWRGNQRLRPGCGERMLGAQLVIGQCIGDQHRNGIGFLACRAARAPNAEIMVASGLLFADRRIQNALVKQFQLRLVAKKAGLINGKIFKQAREFFSAFRADQQAVVVVKGVNPAFAQAALQPVLKKVGPARIEVHPTFLVHQGLQQPHFGFA